jgi:hypothetical protein
MKLKTLLIALALLIFTLGVTVGSLAQVEPKPLLKVNIPFEFTVGGMHLPAGEYTLLHIGGSNTIMLRNAEGHGEALVRVSVSQVNPEDAATMLTFTKYGNKVFLSQIWTEQDNQVHQCFKCREEMTAEAQKGQPSTMTIKVTQP